MGKDADDRRRTRDTSYEGIDVSNHKHHNGPPNKQEAVEPLSTTARFVNSMKQNQIIISCTVLVLGVIGSQMLFARDSAAKQPLVDSHQDFQIVQNRADIDGIDKKLDTIIEELRQLKMEKKND